MSKSFNSNGKLDITRKLPGSLLFHCFSFCNLWELLNIYRVNQKLYNSIIISSRGKQLFLDILKRQSFFPSNGYNLFYKSIYDAFIRAYHLNNIPSSYETKNPEFKNIAWSYLGLGDLPDSVKKISQDELKFNEEKLTDDALFVRDGWYNNRHVAIKIFDKSFIDPWIYKKQILNEILLMNETQGFYVVKLHGISCLNNGRWCLVTEYYDTTLSSFEIPANSKLDYYERLIIAQRLALAIESLQSKDIIIGDLYLSHIFLDKDGNVRLGNFKKAKQVIRTFFIIDDDLVSVEPKKNILKLVSVLFILIRKNLSAFPNNKLIKFIMTYPPLRQIIHALNLEIQLIRGVSLSTIPPNLFFNLMSFSDLFTLAYVQLVTQKFRRLIFSESGKNLFLEILKKQAFFFASSAKKSNSTETDKLYKIFNYFAGIYNLNSISKPISDMMVWGYLGLGDLPHSLQIAEDDLKINEIVIRDGDHCTLRSSFNNLPINQGRYAYIIYTLYKNKPVAIKLFKRKIQIEPDLLFVKEPLILKQNIINEVLLMHEAQGPHIIKLLGISCLNDGGWCLVMDYYGDTLLSFIRKQDEALPYEKILNIVLKLAEAIDSLHSKNILHNDLHSRNVYIDNNNDIKIGDFGLSTKTETEAKVFIPAQDINISKEELVISEQFSKPRDIYQMGQILNDIKDVNFITIYNTKLDEIIQSCLVNNSLEQPSIKTIINELKAEMKSATEKKIHHKTPKNNTWWTPEQLNKRLNSAGFTRKILEMVLIPYKGKIKLWIQMIKNPDQKLEADFPEIESIHNILQHFFLSVLQKLATGWYHQNKPSSDKPIKDAYYTIYTIAFDIIQGITPAYITFPSKYYSYEKARKWLQAELFEHFIAEEFIYRIFLRECDKLYKSYSKNSTPLTNPRDNVAAINSFSVYWPIFLKTSQDLLQNGYVLACPVLKNLEVKSPPYMPVLGYMIDMGLLSGFAQVLNLKFKFKLKPRQFTLLLMRAYTRTTFPMPLTQLPRENYWRPGWAVFALLNYCNSNLSQQDFIWSGYAIDPDENSLVHWAAKHGYLPILARLNQLHVRFDFYDPHGQTALHIAVKYHQMGVVKMLLDCGMPVDIETRPERLTPLQLALTKQRLSNQLIRNSTIHLVNLLIRYRADLFHKNFQRNSVLAVAKENCCLYLLENSIKEILNACPSLEVHDQIIVYFPQLIQARAAEDETDLQGFLDNDSDHSDQESKSDSLPQKNSASSLSSRKKQNPATSSKDVVNDLPDVLEGLNKDLAFEVKLYQEDLQIDLKAVSDEDSYYQHLHMIITFSKTLQKFLDKIERISKQTSGLSEAVRSTRELIEAQKKKADDLKTALERTLVELLISNFSGQDGQQQYEAALIKIDHQFNQKNKFKDQQDRQILMQRRIVLLEVGTHFEWDADSAIDRADWYSRDLIAGLLKPTAINALKHPLPVLLCLQPEGDHSDLNDLNRVTIVTMNTLKTVLKTNMICTICQAWGASSASHFTVNVIIEDTLLIVDPLGGKAIKGPALKQIEIACKQAKLKKVVIVGTKIQDDKNIEKSCGPLSVAIAEKLVRLGVTEIQHWLKKSPLEAINASGKYFRSDITELLQQSMKDQTDHLSQILKDPQNYDQSIQAILQEQKQRINDSVQDEKIKNSLQALFDKWVGRAHFDKLNLSEIMREDQNIGEGYLEDLLNLIAELTQSGTHYSPGSSALFKINNSSSASSSSSVSTTKTLG